MAKTFGAVLGKQSGRIGQIVGRVTRGKQFYAALPTVAKDRKPSAKEQDVRLKFKTLTQLAKGFKQGIRVSLERYAKYAPYINTFNHFVKINKAFVHAEGGIAEVEYGSLLLAPESGDIPGVGFSAASFEEPQRVSVTFTPNSDVPMADSADDVYLFIYEPESNSGMLSTPVKRSAASAEVRLPSTWSGLTVHVYGFTIGGGRENEGLVSASAYVGAGNVG